MQKIWNTKGYIPLVSLLISACVLKVIKRHMTYDDWLLTIGSSLLAALLNYLWSHSAYKRFPQAACYYIANKYWSAIILLFGLYCSVIAAI